MASDPGDDPVSLTREGKRILRERFAELKESEGLSLEKLGSKVGCSYGTIRLLINDEATIGSAMEPMWSSQFVPGLCRSLRIPLWEVTAGLDDSHRKALAAVDRVRALAPDALDEFLDGVEDLAEGKIARHAARSAEDAPRLLPAPSPRPVR